MEKALPLLKSSGDKHTYFLAKVNYAIGLCEIGLVSESINLSNQILRTARKYGYKDLIAFAYRNKGMCYLRKNRLCFAISNTEEAYNLYKLIAHWKDSGLAAQDLSSMLKISGDIVASEEYARLSRRAMKKVGLKKTKLRGRFSEKLIFTKSKLPKVDPNGYILINMKKY